MQSTFPILRFSHEAYMIWATAAGLNPYNGEFLAQIERNGRTYNLGKDTATHVEYYPVLSPAEQLIDAHEFHQSLADILVAKGHDIDAQMTIGLKTPKTERSINAYVYYGLEGDRQYLYTQSCFQFESPEHMYAARATKLEEANRVKTEKEMRLGKMLDMIAEVQEMAGDMEIPADFINPLTAMAEQLRTNILEHKPGAMRESDDEFFKTAF